MELNLPILDEITHQLIVLSERNDARVTDWTRDRPTDWRPEQVRNPNGMLDTHFTDTSAWELIATQLRAGCVVEVVELRKPPGARGYVLKIPIESGRPYVYIKLQLGAGKIIGRSFHYSKIPS